VRRIIDRIISPLGRRCDESNPMVDARLPDGSRVNVIIPPLALEGPTMTIRKFARVPLTSADLVTRGSATPELVEFLRACVLGRMNVIVAGGTGTGKTTMLNVLSSFIPEDERIITIENAAELQLQQRHVVPLESRPANIEGRGEVDMRDLVVNALRMRPDRIIVGECRAGEALDMLQAMNTGHDGSMTTLHANTPRDAIRRMETMVLMSGMDLPMRAIREQIASAIDLIVQLERMQDGSRRITHVSEVVGMENDTVTMSDIFTFQHQGMRDGKVAGRIAPTGLRQRSISLPPQMFGYAAGRKP
jgi:pilus assembly protein CpaF